VAPADTSAETPGGPAWRARVHEVIGDEAPDSGERAAVRWLMIALIVVSVAGVALETVEPLRARHAALLMAVHGEYFGEIALLTDTVRTATVTAVSECELLTLDVADFRRLLDAHPDVRETLTRVAEQRLAGLTPALGQRGGPPEAPSG
jgi:CRP-like cAMP-binding protein